MRRLTGLLFCSLFATLPLAAQFQPNCQVNTTATEQTLVCPIPGNPNAPLVLYAHGYVSPYQPSNQLPLDQFILDNNGTPLPLPTLVNSLGFAFAATSYTKTGLAVKEGVADTLRLLETYKVAVGVPLKVFIAGVSEGGLITVKLIEQHAGQFDGALALCGPYGDFRRQLDHVGDFRAVYDYFFPDLLPGNAIFNPAPAALWPTFIPQIAAAAAANPNALAQTYSVEKTPVDPALPVSSAVQILRYSFEATNDANAVLGGNPFDNRLRWYFGSSNDFRLNWKIERFAADRAALQEIAANYQTTGVLTKPLVTMHTTGDPVVPYSQAALYTLKALLRGSLPKYAHIPIQRYGHCTFQPAEIVFGFSVMVNKSGLSLTSTNEALPTEADQMRFQELVRTTGAEVR